MSTGTLWINTVAADASPSFKPFVGRELAREDGRIWITLNKMGVRIPVAFAPEDLDLLNMNHVLQYRFCRTCFGSGTSVTDHSQRCTRCGGSGNADVVLAHHGPGEPSTLTPNGESETEKTRAKPDQRRKKKK